MGGGAGSGCIAAVDVPAAIRVAGASFAVSGDSPRQAPIHNATDNMAGAFACIDRVIEQQRARLHGSAL
jgi:hypothetical protein